MKVLVTGATGFLGTALCRELERRCELLVPLGAREADLTQPDALRALVGQSFDRIYHLAGWTQAGDFCLKHPGEQWVRNQLINTNVLAWWHHHQPQAKLISVGTSCAYAPDADLAEENYLAGQPTESLYTDAMTKRMLYIGQVALAQQYGLRFLTFVPATLYGPGHQTEGRPAHFIFDLIRKILRGRLYDEPVELSGDGTQKRELVYLDDFVELCLRLSDGPVNQLVNIGAGEEFSIRFLAQSICQIVGYDFGKVQFGTTKHLVARSKCLKIDRLRSLVPDLRLTPLEVGLPRTVAWFWDNREGQFPAGRSVA